jgi:hypothetical protein
MAHRVVKRRGSSEPAVFMTNCRLPSAPTLASHALTSTSPDADRMASMMRALSRSVWRRPTIQVPALDMSL